MAYCGPRGIPLSKFLRWDPDDQAAALTWASAETERCGRCGTHPDDWKPDKGGHRHAYTLTQHRCPGCELLDRAADAPADRGAGRGVHVGLTPTGHHPLKRATTSM